MKTDLENIISLLATDDNGWEGDVESPTGSFAKVIVTSDEIDESFKESYSNFCFLSADFDWDNLPGYYFVRENSDGIFWVNKCESFDEMEKSFDVYMKDYSEYLSLEDA